MTTVAPRDVRDVEVCVVGAGPHALTVVSHLLVAQPTLRNRIAVLDPSGEWLQRWRTQFARLEIDVLRSPIVHHPHVGPGALAQYIGDERLPRSGLPYDPPLTSTFESFCTRVINGLGVEHLPSAAQVRSLHCGDRVAVDCDTQSIRARHVVWTGNTATRVVPDACVEPMVTSSRIVHGDGIDLRRLDSLGSEHVVVVGGGLTAGHLAMAAVSRGATVTLVTRRPVVERDFDVEPGWLGPRFLDGYWRMRSPRRRLERARSARGGGSMPRWMWQRIQTASRTGRLEHLVGEIDEVVDTAGGLDLRVADRTIAASRCWLATGTRPDALADDALAGVVGDHVDGVPVVDRDLRVGESDVFVTGRLATIELGPAAGNLWGARMAARRIGRAITGIDLDTDEAAAIPPPPLATTSNGSRR